MARTVWLLDSGAFSAKYSGAVITVDEYAGFLRKHEELFDGGAINLDVIGDRRGSYENWLRLRSLGAETIPVFHLQPDDKSMDDGYSFLDKYLGQTDHICIGGIARLNTEQRTYGLDALWNYLVKRGADKTHKFHGLGLTRLALMTRFPWYSVDSATAVKNAMNGAIFIPKRTEAGSYDYLDSRQYRVSDQGQHIPGSAMSFYGLPQGGRLQSDILRYCAEIGYPLPATIEGRILRPRKSRPGESRDPVYSLGLGTETTGDAEENLASDYKMRESHNFAFFNRLISFLAERGQNLRLYTVLGSPPQFDRYFERAGQDGVAPTLLVNYWLLKTRSAVARLVIGSEVDSGRKTRRAPRRTKGGTPRARHKGTG
jgi:hypothetical protein